MSHLLELVEEADRNHNGKIDFEGWKIMGESWRQPNHQSLVSHSTRLVKRIKKKIPMAASHLEKVRRSNVDSFRCLPGALGPGFV